MSPIIVDSPNSTAVLLAVLSVFASGTLTLLGAYTLRLLCLLGVLTSLSNTMPLFILNTFPCSQSCCLKLIQLFLLSFD